MSWIEDLLARLATIDTVVDAIQVITDALPDAGALTTIQADLDNPDQYKANVAALALEATVADLITRVKGLDDIHDDAVTNEALQATSRALLVTVAGYLDTEIAAILAAVDTEVAAIETKLDTPANFMADVAALALEASLGTHDTDIKALLATIAGYLDTEIAAILALVDSAEAAGPFSYLDAGGEQDVVVDALTTRRRIWLDFSNRNMTQTGTFRIYRKVNGADDDLYAKQPVTVGADEERAWDAEFTVNQGWKLTYQEDVDEGAARAIPYNIITQVIE